MVGRNNNKLTKVQPTLKYITTAAASDFYVDVAEGLSMINRKLFSSEYCYKIKSVRFKFSESALFDRIQFQAITAGDTWSVHNAWTKGKALHSEMQDLVLDDNPSLAGKWSEFKVYLDDAHEAGLSFTPVDANGAAVLAGEWNHSTFVMPQHEVDPVTGLPLGALEVSAHLIGPDSVTGRSLVKAYAQSRATVQPNAPNVPATVPNSFFNLLTDSGSQEPELAQVIIDENDQPPYHPTDYPGGSVNAPGGWSQGLELVNSNSPNGVQNMFNAQCGLIHFRFQAFLGAASVAMPAISFYVELARGSYKGIDAIPMGQ